MRVSLPSTIRATLVAVLASGVVPAASRGQDTLPFTIGERLVYRVHVGRTGTGGRAAMAVAGPVTMRDVPTELLSFDVTTGLGPIRVTDRSRSWLDPVRMTALRFWKQESRPFGYSDQSVEIDGAARRWTDASGASGTTPSGAPLDELSFIYFLRTLPLTPGAVLELDRHYDAARNPTEIEVLGQDSVTTGVGRFRATVVEMRVRDAARYGGRGVIRLALSDDRCRIPLRMESTMPVVGTVVLTLASEGGVRAGCAGAAPEPGALRESAGDRRATVTHAPVVGDSSTAASAVPEARFRRSPD